MLLSLSRVSVFYIMYMYMEIHVHSTLAKENNGRKVIPTCTCTHVHKVTYVTLAM